MPRHHSPETIYHAMSRGVERRVIFTNDGDYHAFIEHVAAACKADSASLFAHCLMPNHFHLLIAVNQTPLAVTMQKALTRYALRFNRKQQRVGHLFQSRYTSLPCLDLGYLLQLFCYIPMNPVRAKLVARPGQWRWSSHMEFVEGPARHLSLERLEAVAGMTAAELRELYLQRIDVSGDSAPGTKQTLAEIVARAAETAGIPVNELRNGKRGNLYTQARCNAVRWASEAGYSDVELAAALGCVKSAISQLRRRFRQLGA